MLRAPGNRTPLTIIQFSFINNINLNESLYLNSNFTGLILSGLTDGHNTDSLNKEIAVFYDLKLLYNVKRLRAPGNRTPLFRLIKIS